MSRITACVFVFTALLALSSASSGSGSKKSSSASSWLDLPDAFTPAEAVIALTEDGVEPINTFVSNEDGCVRFYNLQDDDVHISSLSGPNHPWRSPRLAAGETFEQCFNEGGDVVYLVTVASRKRATGIRARITVTCSDVVDTCADGTTCSNGFCVSPLRQMQDEAPEDAEETPEEKVEQTEAPVQQKSIFKAYLPAFITIGALVAVLAVFGIAVVIYRKKFSTEREPLLY